MSKRSRRNRIKSNPEASTRQRTAFREAEAGPTQEWRERSDFAQIEAPRIPGHDGGNVRTVRRVSAIDRWYRDGWIDDREHAALERWQSWAQTANYGRMRSCCDDTPANGNSGRPERMIDAGRRYARANQEIMRSTGIHALRIVVGFIEHDGRLADAYQDAFPMVGQREAYTRAQSVIRNVARAVAVEVG